MNMKIRSATLLFVLFTLLNVSQSSYYGPRQKRQHGARMYLPASSITPGGEGDDPSEWTPWSSPSECSRSCGGGVAYQTRECLRLDSDGAPACRGGNRKYYSCNTQDCPEEDADFRAQQCSRFDSVQFDGVYYEWVPYTNAPNPCELNCMPKGERFYYRQKQKVIDGTRCNDKDLDVCVDGQCQPVGCDMMLGSDAKEDQCRKCGGDGSTCKTIADTFTTSNLAAGYNDILLIPKGATNIRIQETAPSNNYLACRNLTSHYYLNGNWRIDFPRPMFYAGSWWIYQRKPTGFAAPDQLTCSGPITESIYIVMLVQDKSVSIDYEYSIPESVSHTSPEVYTWTHMEYGACNASCGGGWQNRAVTCNNRLNLQEVDAGLCDSKAKPSELQACGTEPCAPHWVEAKWSKCSKGCGADGVQNRTVTCERVSPNGEKTVEDDAVCLKLVGNKPATVQECNRDIKNCPKYHLGPWTPCDKLCGEGKQTRKVTCYIKENGRKRVLKDEECIEERPETEQQCILAPCEGVDWIISQWSGCDACGQNVETRTAICGSKSGKVYGEEFCAPEVPLLTRPCKSDKCQSQWFSSEWSQCSAACGKGLQSRIVICGIFDGMSVTPAADDTKCDAAKKPLSEQDCEGVESVCPGQWFTGPWSSCSKPCGGGERVREILCLANGTKADSCDESKLEALSEKCNTEPCEDGQFIPLDKAVTLQAPESKEEDEEEDCLDDEPEVESGAAFKDLDEKKSSSSPLIFDEQMFSDAPASPDYIRGDLGSGGDDDGDGSGDEEDTTEGSGDDLTTHITADGSTTEIIDTTESGITGTSGSDVFTSSKATMTSVDFTTNSVDSTTVSEASSSQQITSTSDSSIATTEYTSTATESSTLSESTTSQSTTDDDSSSQTTDASSPSSEPTTTTEEPTTSTTLETPTTESSSSESTAETTTAETTTDTSEESTTIESTSIWTTIWESTIFGSTTESLESSTESSAATTDVPSTTDEFTTDSSAGTESTSEVVTESTTEPASTTDESTSEQTTQTADGSTTEISSSTETTVDQTTDQSSDSSTVGVTTDYSLSSEIVTTEDIWGTDGTTPNTLQSVFTEDSKPKKCKPRKKKADCKKTEHGCCPDGKTVAKGPFDEGCPIAKTCAETKYGCCLDGVSPAQGKHYQGCPKSQCAETLFGCCPDNFTPADGEDNEGCPEPTTLPPTTTAEPTTTIQPEDANIETTDQPEDVATTISPFIKSCAFEKYGCCPDGSTAATGEDFSGCPHVAIPETPLDCRNSTHGCCPDGRLAASGPNYDGCPACTREPFGCCRDNQTAAHGPLGEGCCLNSLYGCCLDNINSARGPNYEDCDCRYTPYGCCPDNTTSARGPSNEGCPCEFVEFGCCPDKLTAAKGPKFEGCGCETTQFGCCPDGLTIAQGPHHYGCHCSQTEFQCCPDEKTPAKGPSQQGCTCLESKYGCCPDGVTSAQGQKFEGCENVEEPLQKMCGLPKETGTCGNYSIKYYFDTTYGACTKFWYGGCGGNGNRFNTEVECKQSCQEYNGKNVCLLPKSAGPCTGYSKKWYYDTERQRCDEFVYSGCYGTTNRFDSLQECQNTCSAGESLPTCEQPVEPGPCSGSFERWYYDNQTDVCRPFTYGGCKGNKNNYPTEHACNYHCRQPGVHKDYCALPKQTGDCSEQHPRWFYSELEQRCTPFYYTGCGGNKNNFPTLESCEAHCPKHIEKDICEIPAEVGDCTNYTTMWYYDTKDQHCRQYYYGGCGGNTNRFSSEESCAARCERKPETTTPAPRATATPAPPTRPAAPTADLCQLPSVPGDCDDYTIKYYFNATEGRCAPFYYGGCGGNENRFENEQICAQRCSASDSEEQPRPDNNVAPPEDSAKCFLPAERGNCASNQTRWYYNSAEGLCDVFEYSGCDGNDNNYATEDQCQNECLEAQTTCSLPPIRGRCNDKSRRWYYDERSGECHEFEFTGCRGNRNNFITAAECLSYCRGNQPSRAQPEPPSQSYSVCNLQPEHGECDNYTTAWFYDSEKLSCVAFTYTGCGGNGNRFVSREQCERQCGEFHGVDVCREPVVTGPCRQWQTRFYYNSERHGCEPFTYGGCDGTGNRFNDRAECESVCIVGQEPRTTANKDICKLPVTIGRCNGQAISERRWYYADDRGTCLPFVYSGCSGNQNNFRSYEACNRYCGKPTVDNEIPAYEVTPSTNPCEQYEEECRHLRCPYGTQRAAVDSQCTRCVCENPCDNQDCPDHQQCAVDVVQESGVQQYVPVCRDVNKAGECPQLAVNSSNCARECYTDADCRADLKCCSDSCGQICVQPVQPTRPPLRPTTPPTVVIYPGEVKAALEPKPQPELDVQTSLGGIAVLRCFATGNPVPNITWSLRNVVIDTNQGRFVLTSNGDLTIVQVRQTDDGTYVCVASNGLGEPVRREVELRITEPKEIPAYIYGKKNATQIVTLNSPAQVRCPAGGYPAPHVSWWRNRKRLSLVNDRYELTRDYSLMFRSLQLSDLGPYTCDVYNGRGRPASLTITLKAIGPARALSAADEPYLQYVIDPATAPVTRRPTYPYYPSRPIYVPPPVYVIVPNDRPQKKAQAALALDPRNTYQPGSTIALSCSVQGYPTPNVTWTKNEVPLAASERIQISADPHRLIVNEISAADSGTYGCLARNSFSYSISQENINIEVPTPVNPDCTDNPFFAKCDLIVKGRYCHNSYYAKFCCRSCTLAGQIAMSLHPNEV